MADGRRSMEDVSLRFSTEKQTGSGSPYVPWGAGTSRLVRSQMSAVYETSFQTDSSGSTSQAFAGTGIVVSDAGMNVDGVSDTPGKL